MKRSILWFGVGLGGFLFYVGNFFNIMPVQAQARPSDRPDFKIMAASFDGTHLHVEYGNGTGVPIVNRRYDIGFVWVDAAGQPIGARRYEYLTQFDRGGITIIDSNRRYDLNYKQSGRNIGLDRLSWYLEARPNAAVALRVSLDDSDFIFEADETNNVAVLPILRPDLAAREAKTVTVSKPEPKSEPKPEVAASKLPDLTITKAMLDTAALRFQYHNLGEADAMPTVSFWYEWVDARGQRVGELYWINVGGLSAKRTLDGNQLLDFSKLDSARGAITLGDFVALAPASATHLKLAIDGPNAYGEANEQNNAVLLPKPVLPKPDLMVEAVIVVDGQPQATIWNRGTGSSPAFAVAFEYRDVAGKPLVSGTPGIINGIFGLPPDGKVLPRLLGTIPATAVSIRVTVDPVNAIAESDETNNIKDAPAPMVDLAIGEAALAADGLHLAYRNIGNRNADATISIWVHLADAQGTQIGPLYWTGVSPLRAEGTQVLQNETSTLYSEAGAIEIPEFLASALPQATHLKILLDGPNRILESDERNNVVLLVKPVALLPDFAISNFVYTPERLRMTLVNAGTAAAPRAPEWEFRWIGKDDATLGASPRILYSIGWPAPDKSVPFELPYATGREDAVFRFIKNPLVGAVALEVALDPANTIVESDEANNTARVALPAQSDLIVSGVAVRDGALRFEVRNIGTAAAQATDVWLMWFGAKGALPSSGAVDLPALLVGATTVVSIPLDGVTETARILENPPKEGIRLRIFADGSRKVEEVNEQNNEILVERSVLAKQAQPENQSPIADAGEDIIERDDNGDGLETVRFYSRNSKDPDGKIIVWSWTENGKEVAVGQYPYWWKVPVGVHQITLTVTDDKGATATDTVMVTVNGPPKSPPDLVVDSIVIEPAQPKPGDAVFFTVRTVNRGAVSAGAVSSLHLDIDLDNDQSINIQLAQPVLKDLAPGESQDWHWNDPRANYYNWKATAGTNRIIACADTANYIKEVDEKNNCKEMIIVVGAPTIRPQVELNLTVEVVRPASAASAATFSTAGFVLALMALASGGFLIHGHHGFSRGARGLLAVFPLLLTSARTSYMRLGDCGPEGCVGKHFETHKTLKRMAHASLITVALTGMAKLLLAAVLATAVSGPVYAEEREVYVGDSLSATMTAINVGTVPVKEMLMTLKCPNGTSYKSAKLNGGGLMQDPSGGMRVTNMELKGIHRLQVNCAVDLSAIYGTGRVTFAGTVQAHGLAQPLYSNTVVFKAILQPPKPKEDPKPEVLSGADLIVGGIGLLPENGLDKSGARLSGTFTAIVQNTGKLAAAGSATRLRVDIGADGSWDLTPANVATNIIDAQGQQLIKWSITWNAPTGPYLVEVCADSDVAIKEANESNNCLRDTITLQTGEDPVVEEGMGEE